MLSFASRLSEANEYLVGSWGQSNQNPKGKVLEAVPSAPHLLVQNGFDALSTASSGGDTVLTLTEPINGGGIISPTNSLVGMEVRMIRPIYGTSVCIVRTGKGTVTANSATEITVSWDVLPPSLTSTFTGGFSWAAANKISFVANPVQNGDVCVFNGTPNPLPPEISPAIRYFVVNRTANDFQISLTQGGAPVAFTPTALATQMNVGFGLSLRWLDDRGLTWPNVRVLTPWMPEAPGLYPAGVPAVPSVVFPANILTYEDAGLFLPFTFNEGIDGYGASNSGATVSYGASTLTDTSLSLLTNILKGGYVQVGAQIRQVASNTGTVITLTQPWSVVPSAQTEYEAWVPHFRDNPHSRTVGFGFRYPSNHHQPGFLGTGFTYNRPRARLVPSYVPVTGTGNGAKPDYRFGPMFEMGWTLSARIGRRVNIVHLAADASSLVRNTLRGGSPATLGWWTAGIYLDWIIDTNDNLAYRFRKLLTIMAPAALLAEGNTRPLKYLGESAMQGESETLNAGKTYYGKLLTTIHSWIRTILQPQSYYPSPLDFPVVHAGFSDSWIAVDAAGGGYVLSAINDWTAIEPAAETYSMAGFPLQGADPAHMTGLGELMAGDAAAAALAGLIDDYVSQSVDDNEVDICNLALAMFGETAKVFSLDTRIDQSTEAAACKRFFPVARDTVLEGHSWAFATRMTPLIEVTKDTERTDWAHAYALPSNLAAPLEVLPPGAATALPGQPANEMTPFWRVPSVETGNPKSKTGYLYSVERNSNRQLVLYTNVQSALLRYNIRISGIQVPMKFKQAVARKLAALLAGAFVKGTEGVALQQRLEALARFDSGDAAAVDANRQQNLPREQSMPWDR